MSLISFSTIKVLKVVSYYAVFVLLSGIAMWAQLSGTQGQPLIVNPDEVSAITDAPGTIVDAFVFAGSGTNICDRIYDAFHSAPGKGVTVDARGFTLEQTCPTTTAHQPFIPSNSTGRLLLGNVWIKTAIPWVIPSGVEVIGLGPSGVGGDGSSSGPVNTVIVADTGLPNNTAVMQLGGSSGQTGVRVKSLTVDCMGKAGCIGVENMFSGEGSTVEDVAIDNAPKSGLHVVIGDPVHGLYAAYSGPYRNITVQYPSCGSCGSAVGVLVECLSSDHINCVNGESPVVVHFDNITASAVADATFQWGSRSMAFQPS